MAHNTISLSLLTSPMVNASNTARRPSFNDSHEEVDTSYRMFIFAAVAELLTAALCLPVHAQATGDMLPGGVKNPYVLDELTGDWFPLDIYDPTASPPSVPVEDILTGVFPEIFNDIKDILDDWEDLVNEPLVIGIGVTIFVTAHDDIIDGIEDLAEPIRDIDILTIPLPDLDIPGILGGGSIGGGLLLDESNEIIWLDSLDYENIIKVNETTISIGVTLDGDLDVTSGVINTSTPIQLLGGEGAIDLGITFDGDGTPTGGQGVIRIDY